MNARASRRAGRAAGTAASSPGGTARGDAGRAGGVRRVAAPGAALWIVAAWLLLLLAAPPDHNLFWGVNAFRSLAAEARALALGAAAAVAALAWVRTRAALPALAMGAMVATLLAFALPEAAHFLGDTQVRRRAMAVFSAHMVQVTLAEWSVRMHANPLDIAVDFLGPIGLRRLGLSLSSGISLVSMALAMAFFAGVWRVSARLGAPAGARLGLCAALALAGTLEVFAAYAESAGLLLAAAAWWWAEMLTPLAGRRQALRVAVAWLALFLAHRLALVMLLPLAWRALGPAQEGDRPGGRRALTVAGPVAAAIAVLVLLLGVGGRQLGMDARDLLPALGAVVAAVPPSDVLNTLALVAPLAFLAPWLAGRGALPDWFAAPRTRLVLVAALPLLPLAWIVPAGANALGAQRDWDLAALAGWTLTLAAVLLLARLPEPRLRGALAVALPVLALHAGAWVATNADATITMRRARAILEGPPRLADPQQSHLLMYLGQRAMDQGEPRNAAPQFERAFELNPNPRRALMASEAWGHAGDLARARALLARARAAGPLSPSLQQSAAAIEAFLERREREAPAAPDSTAAP
jgi:hypothetical protein